MKTLEEQIKDFNLYLNKLKRVVSTEKSFSFGSVRIVSKAKIDDVICCIQSSYPPDYKDYVKRNGVKSLQTYLYYQQVLNIATKKFILSSGHYQIDYLQLEKQISTLSQLAQNEIKKIIDDNSFKL